MLVPCISLCGLYQRKYNIAVSAAKEKKQKFTEN